MPKEDNSSLFQLIHGMNKLEKRHFKLYSRYSSPGNKEINYLRLFDAIAKQKEYDEEKIQQLNLVRKEHLRMLKNYLYNLILESLRVLRQKSNDVDIRIKNLVENELIMREKGNEKEEYKFLHKAKQIAIENERWGIALDLLLRESAKRTRERNMDAEEKVEKEIASILEKMNNLLEYKKAHRKTIQLLKKADRRKVSSRKGLSKTLELPLLQNIKKENSVLAKREYFLMRMTWENALGNFKAALNTNIEALNFLQANYSKLDFAEVHYASLLNNITCMQFEAGQYEDAFETIQKNRSFTPKTIPVKNRVFIFSYTNESNYYLLKGEFEKGIEATKGFEEKLRNEKPYRQNMRALHSLYFNVASLYFGAQKFEPALKWTRKITNAQRETSPEDILSWAHILSVLIHYEMNTPDIIEHLTSSTYRYLYKRDRLYKVEESILNFIRKINRNSSSKKELHNEFIQFKKELLKITEDPKEKNALYYFDILSWLESKIENKPLSEIVKNKLEKK